MENGPFIDDFPINTSIYKGFSMAMLNNQMVIEQILNIWIGIFPQSPAVVVWILVGDDRMLRFSTWTVHLAVLTAEKTGAQGVHGMRARRKALQGAST
jgi:hypothetical protein